MRRGIWSAIFLLLFLEVFSLLPGRVSKPDDAVSPPHRVGAIHVPLRKSPKAGRRVCRAATRAGMDFVVLANHDAKIVTTPECPGVDLYPEIETTTDAGHALLFFSHTKAKDLTTARLRELAWQHFLGSHSYPGLMLVVAHPSSVSNPWERLDRFPDGTELINLRALVEKDVLDNPLSAALTLLIAPLNRYLAALRLYDLDPRDFRGWDAMNAISPGHFGLAGVDALSDWPILRRMNIHAPRLEESLSITSNVVFPDGPLEKDFDKRRLQTYRAIRDGRSAILFGAIHPFEGNDWAMVCGKAEYRSGDRFALRQPGCEFVVRIPKTLPYSTKLVLIREGEVVSEIENPSPIERIPVTDDGAYRLEVWVKPTSLLRVLFNREVLYLLYNPLYVR